MLSPLSQVTELPYPFKSVKDFEASLRAPVGRQFVPEVVHKKLTAPPIVTKMGTVIQPMTEDELLHYKTTTKDKAESENRQNDTRGGRKRKIAGGTHAQQNSKRKLRQGQNKGSS